MTSSAAVVGEWRLDFVLSSAFDLSSVYKTMDFFITYIMIKKSVIIMIKKSMIKINR